MTIRDIQNQALVTPERCAVAKLLETSAAESRAEDFGEVPVKLDLWQAMPHTSLIALPCARIQWRSQLAERKGQQPDPLRP